MYLNSLLQKIEDNALPTARTVITFKKEGVATIFCDMLPESFYHWLAESEIISHSSYRQTFEGIAHECVFDVTSLDGSCLQIMGVK